ncbi:hypothetical protein H6788_00980 [Candidatus Nomurabacteria bacterium]|nr:hypothetical protein [Candidatus Nomurabacteria bacterium]
MDDNNNSGVNTILIVVALVAIVGFGVWYFMSGNAAPEDDNAEFNINMKVPTSGNDEGGESETTQ